MNIRISVRSLVEFIFRSGDISDSSSGALPVEAMNAGSRIHRKLQKRAGSYYASEVPLKITSECGGHVITVEGRADGIIDRRGTAREADGIAADKGGEQPDENKIQIAPAVHEPDVLAENEDEGHVMDMVRGYEVNFGESDVMIDEIKGVYRNLDDVEEPLRVHVAQAMCYAYIYAREKRYNDIDVRISYVNLDSEKEKFFRRNYRFGYLEEWFASMTGKLAIWLDMVEKHICLRDESIVDMEFPFEYRKGQKEMALYVYKAIEKKGNLYVQAPTGIGKTMAAVYPTIKSFVQGDVSKLFYLTAKTIAHTVARGAIQKLMDRGLEFKTVILTAKEKICLQDEMDCNPALCPYANGHFDRVNEALYDLVSNESIIDREIVRRYAERYQVCPFELSLDASLFADAVIGDYNYVFDPRASLKRFFAGDGNAPGNYVFLVDEAHNLVDRASSMYSAHIIKEDFLELRKLTAQYGGRLTRYLSSCNRELLALKKNVPAEGYEVLPSIAGLHLKLLGLHDALDLFLEEHGQIPERKEVLNFYFNLTSFLNIAEIVDENYIMYDEILPDGRFMVKLYCVKPAANISACLDKGLTAVFFSATILPIRYYMEMLSDCPDDQAIYIRSPFAQENRRILIANDVTTRYTRRNDEQYGNIYSYIESVVSAKKGNYMVFFPSYAMLEHVQAFAGEMERLHHVKVIAQTPYMNEADREEFLNTFETENGVLAFCIMGGIFSEGIDLTGDKLVGAIVVGPGLPQVCTERKLMMDYFDARGGSAGARGDSDGFRYAYQYPGINKVFQAAGRVIRTETDRGVILLLDERFNSRRYSELFPVEWNDYEICNRKNVAGLLEDFWKDKSKEN